MEEGHNDGFLYDYDLVDYDIDDDSLAIMVADLFTSTDVVVKMKFEDPRITLDWRFGLQDMRIVTIDCGNSRAVCLSSRWNSMTNEPVFSIGYREGHLDWRGEFVGGELTPELRKSYIARLETNLARFR